MNLRTWLSQKQNRNRKDFIFLIFFLKIRLEPTFTSYSETPCILIVRLVYYMCLQLWMQQLEQRRNVHIRNIMQPNAAILWLESLTKSLVPGTFGISGLCRPSLLWNGTCTSRDISSMVPNGIIQSKDILPFTCNALALRRRSCMFYSLHHDLGREITSMVCDMVAYTLTPTAIRKWFLERKV